MLALSSPSPTDGCAETTLNVAIAAVAMMLGAGIASAQDNKPTKHSHHSHHQHYALKYSGHKHYASNHVGHKHYAAKHGHKHYASKHGQKQVS